jgi:hypothetical protein
MQAYIESTRTSAPGTAVRRDLGLTGQLVVGGTLSTGLLLGGYTVAFMTLTGQMNGNAVLLTSLGLFVIGAVVGLVLSAAAGIVGRDSGTTLGEAWNQVAMGVLYAIPATVIGAMTAGWIGLAVVAVYLGRTGALMGSVAAAVVAALVMVATARLTWESALNVARRLRPAA